MNVDKEIWDQAFLPGFWANIQAYQTAKHPFLKKKLKETIKRTLYKWTDLPPTWVSTEIIRMFEENGINKNPFDLIYPDRKTLGYNENKRTVMLWEHTTPMNEMYQFLVKCKSSEEVAEVMKGYSGVCWITRDEDTRLNKNGHRANREGGWKKVYGDCGINVIDRNQYGK